MHPETFGILVNDGILLLGAIYVTLLGFRVVGKPPGVSFEYDQWHERFGRIFKVGGTLGITCWVSLLLLRAAQSAGLFR
jgi:hypothetical protein